MKVSASLSEDDVAFIGSYAEQAGVNSRSAVLHQLVELLRSADLEDAYAAAWQEWDESGDTGIWDSTTADGISEAAR